MGLLKSKKQNREMTLGRTTEAASRQISNLTCGQVMHTARKVNEMDSMDSVISTMIAKDWDHVMITDERDYLVGRVHAVDMLKLIARNRINRELNWMEMVPISQAVTLPAQHVYTHTPLMVAATLLLTNDLSQIAVVDDYGSLVGMVSNADVSRHLTRLLL